MESIVLSGSHAIKTTMSDITYKQQVLNYTAQRWGAVVKVPQCDRSRAADWAAFLFSLKGQSGTFLMGDPVGAQPRGSAATTPGTPVVNGAGQLGNTLAITGLPASVAGYLLPGDYIQLGAASTATLHMVLTSVTTDASGNATLDIWPDMRASPADASTVVLTDTVGVWRLTRPISEFSLRGIGIYGIEFEAMQAIT